MGSRSTLRGRTVEGGERRWRAVEVAPLVRRPSPPSTAFHRLPPPSTAFHRPPPLAALPNPTRLRTLALPMPTTALVALTTLASEADARALVTALLGDRLIACGTLLPGGRSLYRWQGKMTEESEVVVL